MEKVSTIFKEKPEVWRLRGDTYFWEYLEEIFDNYNFPYEFEDLEKIIKDEHLKLTGIELTDTSVAMCKKFAHRGISSGQIFGKFWISIAFPLLKEKINKY